MAFSIECFSIMLIFSMPRSGSTAFAEKMAVDNDLINNKEFFNRNVRGFNPHLGTYVIKGDLYSIGNFTKVDCENLKPNLPCNMNDRIEILKNGPLNIDDYVVKILPHHVSWVSEDLINLFKDTKTYILYRNDTLRQFLSWYFADATKQYHGYYVATTGSYKNKKNLEERFSTHSELLNKAYDDCFPDGVDIDSSWFERWVGLFQKYMYGTLVIRKHFSNVKVIKYEDIEYQKTLSNEKITIDYSKWVNNINVVKKFTDKINDYNKMLFDED